METRTPARFEIFGRMRLMMSVTLAFRCRRGLTFTVKLPLLAEPALPPARE